MLSTSQLSSANAASSATESSSAHADRHQAPPLFDDSTVYRELGAGGFGSVYQATGLDGKEYALKVAGSDRTASRRLGIEARAFKAIGEHPNIVKSYGMVETRLGPALVLERIPGDTLSRLIDKMQFSLGKFMPETEASMALCIHLAHQLLSGLDHIHQKNVQHGDINPRNLIVTPDGTLKIIDLGMVIKSQGPMIGLFGSVGYLPPEMLYPKPPGSNIQKEKIDTYSASMVLFELFTGLAVGQTFDRLVPLQTELYAHYPMHQEAQARENDTTINPHVHYPKDEKEVLNNIRVRTFAPEVSSSYQKWSEAIVTPRLRAEIEVTSGRGGVWPERQASRMAQIMSDYQEKILKNQLMHPDPRVGRADTRTLLAISQSLHDQIPPALIEEGIRVLRSMQDIHFEHPTDSRAPWVRPDYALGEHRHFPNTTVMPDMKILREQLKQQQVQQQITRQMASDIPETSSDFTPVPLLERRRLHWEATADQRRSPVEKALSSLGNWFQKMGNSVKRPT